jgi:hypothetical protein
VCEAVYFIITASQRSCKYSPVIKPGCYLNFSFTTLAELSLPVRVKVPLLLVLSATVSFQSELMWNWRSHSLYTPHVSWEAMGHIHCRGMIFCFENKPPGPIITIIMYYYLYIISHDNFLNANNEVVLSLHRSESHESFCDAWYANNVLSFLCITSI